MYFTCVLSVDPSQKCLETKVIPELDHVISEAAGPERDPSQICDLQYSPQGTDLTTQILSFLFPL
jgi:hypothetical protein